MPTRTPRRYPFATASGTPIPLDIVTPVGILAINFTTGAGTAGIDLTENIEAILILASQDCIVTFAATNAATGALANVVLKIDSIFISKDVISSISPPVGKSFISIRGDSANGRVILNLIDKWSGVMLQSQLDRR